MVEVSTRGNQLKTVGKYMLCLFLGIGLSAGLFTALATAGYLVYPHVHPVFNDGGAHGFLMAFFLIFGVPLAAVLGLVASLVAVKWSRRPLLVSALASSAIGVGLGMMVFAIMVWG